jgi:hypothetical protein
MIDIVEKVLKRTKNLIAGRMIPLRGVIDLIAREINQVDQHQGELG